MFPLLSTPISCLAEAPASLDKFLGVENAAPCVLEQVKRTSLFPGVLSVHTILIFPLESTAICGELALPASLERFCGAENARPLLVEALKKTCILVVGLVRRSSHTT